MIGFANAGADFQNALKQAAEFGATREGRRLAALLAFITDVIAVGQPTAQGLVLSTSFYWDLNDATREWTRRFMVHKPRVPTMNQAAAYSAVRHYLSAVQASRTTQSKAVAAAMRATAVNDMYNENVRIRDDGRILDRMYLMRVKSPTESRGSNDLYQILSTTPGKEAFRPLAESECSLVRK